MEWGKKVMIGFKTHAEKLLFFFHGWIGLNLNHSSTKIHKGRFYSPSNASLSLDWYNLSYGLPTFSAAAPFQKSPGGGLTESHFPAKSKWSIQMQCWRSRASNRMIQEATSVWRRTKWEETQLLVDWLFTVCDFYLLFFKKHICYHQ